MFQLFIHTLKISALIKYTLRWCQILLFFFFFECFCYCLNRLRSLNWRFYFFLRQFLILLDHIFDHKVHVMGTHDLISAHYLEKLHTFFWIWRFERHFQVFKSFALNVKLNKFFAIFEPLWSDNVGVSSIFMLLPLIPTTKAPTVSA